MRVVAIKLLNVSKNWKSSVLMKTCLQINASLSVEAQRTYKMILKTKTFQASLSGTGIEPSEAPLISSSNTKWSMGSPASALQTLQLS